MSNRRYDTIICSGEEIKMFKGITTNFGGDDFIFLSIGTKRFLFFVFFYICSLFNFVSHATRIFYML